MNEQRAIKVFLSYSHDRTYWQSVGRDPETHRRRVFELSERLRNDGIDCILDQHVSNPREGWPRWMRNQIHDADFVLIICTENYRKRFEGIEESPQGSGAQWEGSVVTQDLYELNGRNEKFIPIAFGADDRKNVPSVLRPWTSYDVCDAQQYDELYYYLTNQPPFKSDVRPEIRKRYPAHP